MPVAVAVVVVVVVALVVVVVVIVAATVGRRGHGQQARPEQYNGKRAHMSIGAFPT